MQETKRSVDLSSDAQRSAAAEPTRRGFLTLAAAGAAAAMLPEAAAIDDKARFDALLAELQGDAQLAAQIRANAEKPEPTAAARSFMSGLQPSKLKISDRAIQLLVATEVTSQRVYEKKYRGAIWPQGASGVTVGIGYDIGHKDEEAVIRDWEKYVPSEIVDRLLLGCGVKGDAAEDLLEGLDGLSIPWGSAYKQFVERQLPYEIAVANYYLIRLADLPADCRGALMSLAYNRGAPGFQARPKEGAQMPDRYFEMRAIREHMLARNFAAIPDELMRMRRLWEGKPNMAGVYKRREAEAVLFRMGLNSRDDLNSQGIVIR